MDRWHWGRTKAVIAISVLVMLIGLPSALSFGIVPGLSDIGGKNFFDWLDFITSNILLPVGGLITTLFAGYFWKKAADAAGLKAGWFRVWLFMLRYIAPVLVFLVLLHTTGVIKFD